MEACRKLISNKKDCLCLCCSFCQVSSLVGSADWTGVNGSDPSGEEVVRGMGRTRRLPDIFRSVPTAVSVYLSGAYDVAPFGKFAGGVHFCTEAGGAHLSDSQDKEDGASKSHSLTPFWGQHYMGTKYKRS